MCGGGTRRGPASGVHSSQSTPALFHVILMCNQRAHSSIVAAACHTSIRIAYTSSSLYRADCQASRWPVSSEYTSGSCATSQPSKRGSPACGARRARTRRGGGGCMRACVCMLEFGILEFRVPRLLVGPGGNPRLQSGHCAVRMRTCSHRLVSRDSASKLLAQIHAYDPSYDPYDPDTLAPHIYII